MAEASGVREVAWLDCAGGGQVVVDGSFAYIGHMDAPHGTSVVDVADPQHPRIVAAIDIPPGLHSHKVRVANGVMLVNREHHGAGPPRGDFVGLRIFDVADPRQPREIARWACDGMGVHRFTFDGRYAYISPRDRGLCRQHRHDPRPRRSGDSPRRSGAGGCRASGPPAARPRPGKGRGASLPSSDPPRRSALRQLLAWRRGDPRHQRHEPPAMRLHHRLEPALRLADAQPWADRLARSAASLDAGRRRTRAPLDPAMSPELPRCALDGRHHRRDAPRAGEHVPGAGTRRQARRR